MPITHFCSYCGTNHPIEEMREVTTKSGKRWRCLKSIEASKRGRESREEFGRRVTAKNKAEAQSKLKALQNAEWAKVYSAK